MDATPPSLSHLHPEHVNYPSRLTIRVLPKHLCLSSLVSATAFVSPFYSSAQQTGVSARLRRRWQVLTRLQKYMQGQTAAKETEFHQP